MAVVQASIMASTIIQQIQLHAELSGNEVAGLALNVSASLKISRAMINSTMTAQSSGSLVSRCLVGSDVFMQLMNVGLLITLTGSIGNCGIIGSVAGARLRIENVASTYFSITANSATGVIAAVLDNSLLEASVSRCNFSNVAVKQSQAQSAGLLFGSARASKISVVELNLSSVAFTTISNARGLVLGEALNSLNLKVERVAILDNVKFYTECGVLLNTGGASVTISGGNCGSL